MVTKKPPCVFKAFRNGPLVKLNEFEQPNLRAYWFFHVFFKGSRGEKLRAYDYSWEVIRFVQSPIFPHGLRAYKNSMVSWRFQSIYFS